MDKPMQIPKIVEKPWGREIWYAHTVDYAGKVLLVSAGKRLSLQKHEIKEETLYLLSGKVILPTATRRMIGSRAKRSIYRRELFTGLRRWRTRCCLRCLLRTWMT